MTYNKEDQKILDEFPKYIGKTLFRDTLKAYYEVERILMNKETISRRSCSCSLPQLKRHVDEMYNGYLKLKNES